MITSIFEANILCFCTRRYNLSIYTHAVPAGVNSCAALQISRACFCKQSSQFALKELIKTTANNIFIFSDT